MDAKKSRNPSTENEGVGEVLVHSYRDFRRRCFNLTTLIPRK